MPNDIYYLTEHLPKPNYYTPKKIETLKDSVKLKNNRYKPFSGNLHKINSNLIKKDPRSYIINHRTIIEAAREEVKHERR